MKKFFSIVALLLMSAGFSSSALANVMVAGADRGGYYYLSPNCNWTIQSVATSGGLYSAATLTCSGVAAASYSYYNGNSAGAPVVSINPSYYVIRRTGGTTGANTYDYAVYKKASCSTPWQSDYIYNDLSSVSYARAMTMQSTPYRCSASNNCTLDILSKDNTYALICR